MLGTGPYYWPAQPGSLIESATGLSDVMVRRGLNQRRADPVSSHELNLKILLSSTTSKIDPRALVKIDTMLKIYPRATENRLHGSDVSTFGPRRAFLRAA